MLAGANPGPMVGGDAVTIGNMPKGLPVYWGYWDGPYANYNAVQMAFPGSTIYSITTGTSLAADEIDCEDGDATIAQAVTWAKSKKNPRIYIQASNVAALIDLAQSSGLTREKYVIRSAHWNIGPHVCGPNVCGYPQVEATQYTTHDNQWDESMLTDAYVNFGVTPPPVQPPTVKVRKPMFVASTDNGATQWLMAPNFTRKNITGSGVVSEFHTLFGNFVPMSATAFEYWDEVSV